MNKLYNINSVELFALKEINFKVREEEFYFFHFKRVLKSQKNHLKRGKLKPTSVCDRGPQLFR